jgi:hypothetical protein
MKPQPFVRRPYSKHTSWNCRKSNPTGMFLEQWTEQNDCVVLAPSEPIHYSTQGLFRYSGHFNITEYFNANLDHNPTGAFIKSRSHTNEIIVRTSHPRNLLHNYR